MPSVRKPASSLTDFVENAKRAKCKVCKLPKEVLAQIRAGRENDITTATILTWLKVEHRIELTPLDFVRHSNARHDA